MFLYSVSLDQTSHDQTMKTEAVKLYETIEINDREDPDQALQRISTAPTFLFPCGTL